ncbi:MAG: hypothetical protein ChlgKO_06930 [Chlamydiales bacterium]
MKFLFTNQGPWGTGSFTAVENIANRLLKLGHEVKIFFPDNGPVKEGDNYYYNQPDLYLIWRFPIKNAFAEIASFPLMVPDPHPRSPKGLCFSELNEKQIDLYFSKLKIELANVIAEFSPDVIDCGHIHVMTYAVQALGAPFFVTAHHIDQLSFKRYIQIQPFAREVARGAKKIIAISTYVKKEVMALYEMDKSKVVTVQNGYEEKTFRKYRGNREEVLAKFGISIPSGELIATFSGKISKTKGVDLLLMANKLLKRKDVHFLICGAGSIDSILDEEERAEISLDRIHLMGHLEFKELALLHNIADFSILPSRSEGFGIGCLEAMACGLPIIYSDSGGIAEYAVGIKVSVENPTELARAIEEMAGYSAQKMNQLSNEAIEKSKKFSWEKAVEERLKIYSE